jgi:uncharacterized phage-associated protein
MSVLDNLTLEDNRLTAIVVATYFIEKGISDCKPIDNLKTQKLVYIAHGWHLGFFDMPLIKEDIQAWTYGPVIPALYKRLKHWGKSPITVTPQDNVLALFKSKLPSDETMLDEVQTLLRNKIILLDDVWKHYGKKTSPELVSLTHQPDTPWSKWWRGFLNTEIPNEEIHLYYQGLVEQHFRGKEA